MCRAVSQFSRRKCCTILFWNSLPPGWLMCIVSVELDGIPLLLAQDSLFVYCECWQHTTGTGFIVCVLSVVSVNSIPLAQDSLFVCCECLTANHLHRIHCLCVCWDCWQQNTSTGVHVFLEDTSSNGTFVNGEKVGECPWFVTVWRVPWVDEWV